MPSENRPQILPLVLQQTLQETAEQNRARSQPDPGAKLYNKPTVSTARFAEVRVHFSSGIVLMLTSDVPRLSTSLKYVGKQVSKV